MDVLEFTGDVVRLPSCDARGVMFEGDRISAYGLRIVDLGVDSVGPWSDARARDAWAGDSFAFLYGLCTLAEKVPGELNWLISKFLNSSSLVSNSSPFSEPLPCGLIVLPISFVADIWVLLVDRVFSMLPCKKWLNSNRQVSYQWLCQCHDRNSILTSVGPLDVARCVWQELLVGVPAWPAGQTMLSSM